MSWPAGWFALTDECKQSFGTTSPFESLEVNFSPDIFVRQPAGGISRYHANLHRFLIAAGVKSTIFVGRNGHQYLEHADAVRTLPMTGSGRASGVGLESIFKAAMSQSRPRSIYHPTYYSAPRVRRRATACTFHDLIHLKGISTDRHAAEVIAGQRRWAKDADVLFAVSRHTATDMVEALGVPEAKLRIVHLAVDQSPKPANETHRVRRRPYVLFVGHRAGYKNWSSVVAALTDVGLRELDFVSVGGGRFTTDETDHLKRCGLARRATQVAASDLELDWLYRDAVCLAYPSLYEGFGMPPLEAMARGTPVVASNRASVPEVVGDAAELCEPEADALAHGIERVCNPIRAADLIRRGHVRVRNFTWQETASRTVDAYRELLA